MPPRNRKRSLETDRFDHERRLLASGIRCLAGVDEAGRGPLAGPVIAAAVVLPVSWVRDGMPSALTSLNDSKQLTERQREAFHGLLMSAPEVRWSVAASEAEEIDRINILQATHRAMRLALAGLGLEVDHALVDGRPVHLLGTPHTALVRGDSLSFSVAAASVLAKVTRDRRMQEWDREYPEYGFAVHKGYGTAAHLEAIRRHGPCPIHRRSFAPLRVEEQSELF